MEFYKYDKMLVSDMTCAATLKEQITKYLKYCLFLETKFRMETYQQSFIEFPTEWSDSYQP